MENRNAQVSKAVAAAALMLVFFGGLARFANLNRKVFGYDESITLMRVAGFTTAETFEQLYEAGAGRGRRSSEVSKADPGAQHELHDPVAGA